MLPRSVLFFLACALPFAAAAQSLWPEGLPRGGYWHGTGFFINKIGHVLTNAHVVDHNCKTIYVDRTPAQLVMKNTELDIAVLKIQKPPLMAAPVRLDVHDLKKGDDTVLLGYPGPSGLYGQYSYRTAKVLRPLAIMTVAGIRGPVLTTESVSQKGNSGGPVLDRSGTVLGMNRGNLTFNGVNGGAPTQEGWIIPLSVMEPYLRQHRIAFDRAPGGMVPLSDPNIVKRALIFTRPIRCYTGPKSPATT